MNPLSSPTETSDSSLFDVRPLPCRIKHGQILQRWLDLPVGGHFVLLNDHDPIPLQYQFEAQFPAAFSWEYLERGPEDFRVKITRLAACGSRPAPVEVDVRGLDRPSR